MNAAYCLLDRSPEMGLIRWKGFASLALDARRLVASVYPIDPTLCQGNLTTSKHRLLGGVLKLSQE